MLFIPKSANHFIQSSYYCLIFDHAASNVDMLMDYLNKGKNILVPKYFKYFMMKNFMFGFLKL